MDFVEVENMLHNLFAYRADFLSTKPDDLRILEVVFTDLNNVKIRGNTENEIYKYLLKFVNNNRVEKFLQNIFTLPTKKNNFLSHNCRLEGNKFYAMKNYHKCLQLYNDSLRFALYNSDAYALVLGNRSAVFFSLNNFEDCLRDIDLSLKGDYPENMKPKLLVREIKCYQQLGCKKQVFDAVQSTLEFLNKTTAIPSFEKENFKTLINGFLKKPCVLRQSSNKFILPNIPRIEDDNEKFPNATKHISLKSENKRGVFATADMKRGDILLVETAYATASTIKPIEYSEVYYFCNYCRTPVIQWIPCRECVNKIYCNDSCRINDWIQSHQWECFGSKVSFWDNLPDEYLSFRIMVKRNNTDEVNRFLEYQTDVCFKKLKTMDASLLKYFASSVVIVKYLEKYTDFFIYLRKSFEEFCNLKLSEAKIRVGGLILKYCSLALLKCVNLQFPRITLRPDGIYDLILSDLLPVAKSFFPSSSNINHSCIPNATYYFNKDTIIIKAIEDIKSGDEIFCAWYGHVVDMDSNNRSIIFESKYKFKCSCLACTNKAVDQLDTVLCVKCKGPALVESLGDFYAKYTCLLCNHQFGFNELFKQQAALFFAIERRPTEEINVENLNRTVKPLENFLSPYHIFLYTTYMSLFLANLRKGDLKEIIKFFKLSTNISKRRLSLNRYLVLLILQVVEVLKHIEMFRLYSRARPFLSELKEFVDEIKEVARFVCVGNRITTEVENAFERIVVFSNNIP